MPDPETANIFVRVWHHWDLVLVWGVLATVLMTTILEGAQIVGVTRLSLPFLFGTFVTGSRRRAQVWGYFLYVIGGTLFAIVYALILETLKPVWWIGVVTGFAHGCFLVCVFLPLLSQLHPRIATQYEGPSARRRLEPPGPLGLNYGYTTPASTVLAQTLYGLVFAIGYASHVP